MSGGDTPPENIVPWGDDEIEEGDKGTIMVVVVVGGGSMDTVGSGRPRLRRYRRGKEGMAEWAAGRGQGSRLDRLVASARFVTFCQCQFYY